MTSVRFVFFFCFLFVAATLIFYPTSIFFSNVSKIMLLCDFLYSYLVYDHKKQNIICFIIQCAQRAPCNIKEACQDCPCFTAQSPNKWKKCKTTKNKQKKNSRLSSSFCVEITFLWCRSLEFEQKVHHGRQGGEMRRRSPVVSAAFTAASSCLESSSADARLATKSTL